ncbi:MULTISPECIES: thiamine diphosphokinase [unclassified Enterococcus]|uniref:thiamine diphosphokinase n=1 Tax=unclassified Enterococcus TaxID=2608891 RepID=UPI001557059A|nr:MULTISPECIES: thiamine diphosphokinase [unclassified Enterococcus]MBS7576024.1 thiamine diphosphokinase [Enterococcus sp. MMGLQ5-2]MBS7583257.1 thiamine diphosphokinase [Enterococcus sp. MMGLQ5-1]NPD11117.1 thiamine diphosphokinase [Enterococcus sp. MMGLQ5-1]NPD35860.1 thiamine diphosphokinase [Enterococcus sp. MMGLQ5-2]
MTKVVIIVAGMVDYLPREEAIYIGVDYGALFLVNNQFPVAFSVGDYDSLTVQEFNLIKQQIPEIHQTIAEKDETDTQLALRLAIERYPQAKFIIYGGTGGRLDHFLANLFLPLEPRFKPFAEQIEMFDAQNKIRYFLQGTHHLTPNTAYRYLAFIPLIATSSFEISGARYELEKTDVLVPTSYASNEFIGQPVTFSFSEGLVCVIESNDRTKLR